MKSVSAFTETQTMAHNTFNETQTVAPRTFTETQTLAHSTCSETQTMAPNTFTETQTLEIFTMQNVENIVNMKTLNFKTFDFHKTIDPYSTTRNVVDAAAPANLAHNTFTETQTKHLWS